MNTRVVLLLALLLSVASTGLAQETGRTASPSAAGHPTPPPPPAYTPPADPKPPVPVARPQPPPPPPELPQEKTYDADNPPTVSIDPSADKRGRKGVRTGFQSSLLFGVPVFLSDPTGSVLSPGFSIGGRFGWDLGYFVPELGTGFMINWFEDNPVGRDGSLSNWWFSLGLRVEGENRSVVTPFISASFDMNLWHLSGDNRYACGWYWCGSVQNFRFSPGFSGMAGVLVDVSESVAIEVAFKASMSFEGDIFDNAESWIGPSFGATFIR